jgi:hypothetical protein
LIWACPKWPQLKNQTKTSEPPEMLFYSMVTTHSQKHAGFPQFVLRWRAYSAWQLEPNCWKGSSGWVVDGWRACWWNVWSARGFVVYWKAI